MRNIALLAALVLCTSVVKADWIPLDADAFTSQTLEVTEMISMWSDAVTRLTEENNAVDDMYDNYLEARSDFVSQASAANWILNSDLEDQRDEIATYYQLYQALDFLSEYYDDMVYELRHTAGMTYEGVLQDAYDGAESAEYEQYAKDSAQIFIELDKAEDFWDEMAKINTPAVATGVHELFPYVQDAHDCILTGYSGSSLPQDWSGESFTDVADLDWGKYGGGQGDILPFNGAVGSFLINLQHQSTCTPINPPLWIPGMLSTEDGSEDDWDELKVWVSTNSDSGDSFEIKESGDGSGEIDVNGSNVEFEGAVIGTWSGVGTSASPLTITINGDPDCTDEAMDALLSHIVYNSSWSHHPSTASKVFTIQVKTGTPTTYSTTHSVTITDRNDTPAISATTSSGTFAESNGNPVNLCLGFDIDDADLDDYDDTDMVFKVSTDRSGGFPAGSTIGILDIGPSDVNVSGSNVRYGTTVLGTISGAASTNDWTINFDEEKVDDQTTYTTQAMLERVIRRVQYDNTGSGLTDETFDVQLYFLDGCNDTSDSKYADEIDFSLTIDGV